MVDNAIELLQPFIDGSTLVLADEQWSPDSWANAATVMTNRVTPDASSRLLFCDFASIEQRFDTVVFRVGKERALNDHWVHLAAEHLNNGGKLVISGGNKEGVKPAIKAAETLFGVSAKVSKHSGIRVAILECHQPIAFDTQSYHQIQTFNIKGVQFVSKPGQFGWKKVDRGSMLLAEAFKDKLKGSVLDLGCGWGYLSVQASKENVSQITSTDNCAAALICCRENLASSTITHHVIASDCADGIHQRFDSIVCNPPFHQGFDHATDLTSRFLESASKRLQPGGESWWVVNQFVGIASLAPKYFKTQRLIERADGFDIWVLSDAKL
ncbi:MAG: class I SAM-dependent methyltransferase [Gammaproteobacteria bacterium]|nr:class I SAM-dependent methyltransferase [Gammaproteobacteria bacterium]